MFFKYIKNTKGTTLVLIPFIFMMLFGFIGLAIDLGIIVYNKQQFQAAVDLTVLAAAQEAKNSSGQVTNTALKFAKKNGLKSGEIIITHPYNGDNLKVELSATKTLPLSFLPVLGVSNKTISARAVAGYTSKTISTSNPVLDYAIFNGSSITELAIKGSKSTVTGNVHSNSSISVSGNGHTFNGDMTACTGISLGNATVTGTTNPTATFQDMPVIGFNTYASQANQIYNTDVSLTGDVTIDGIWLVNGNCSISGLRVSGNGILLVTGEIQIAGSLEYNTYPTAYMLIDGTMGIISPGDILALYSQTNIRISGVNSNISGTMYAPNGQIRIDGSGNTFNGALIANEIIWAGTKTTINGSYHIQTPDSFTVETDFFGLLE